MVRGLSLAPFTTRPPAPARGRGIAENEIMNKEQGIPNAEV